MKFLKIYRKEQSVLIKMIMIHEDSNEERIKQIYNSIVEVRRRSDFENIRNCIERYKIYFPGTAKLTMDKLDTAIQQYEILKKKFTSVWDCYSAEILGKVEINKDSKLRLKIPSGIIRIVKISEDPMLNEDTFKRPKTDLEISIIESLKLLENFADTLKTAFSLVESMRKNKIKEIKEENKKKPQKNVDKGICELEQKIIMGLKDIEKFKFQQENGHIVSVSLNFSSFTKLPENFGMILSKLKYLTMLSISNNKDLESIPKSIGNIKSLIKLSLISNDLTSLPESFKNLKNLTHLALEYNKLVSLPKWFGELKNLVDLRLNDNNLCTLPKSFGNLESLEILDLSNNQLTVLPESFQNFHYLIFLSLEYNKFRSFTNLPIQYFLIETWPEKILEGNNCTQKGKSLYSNVEKFFNYYSKPTLKLAQEYFENPYSLTDDEKGRLAWEGGFREREVLELDGSKILPTDSILLDINDRLRMNLKKSMFL